MKFYELIKLIWVNMMENKFKVLLTSLGIIVGTVTIVLVIAIGQGAEKEAADQYSFLSADTVYINPNYGLLGVNTDASKLEKLTPDLINKIISESTTLGGLYLRASTYKQGTINGQKESFSIVGVTLGYDWVSNLYVNDGSDFSLEDLEDGKRNAIIGHSLAEKYFARPENALGNFIRIGDYQYKIIGVLKKTGDGLQGLSADTSVLIPFTTLENDNQIDAYLLPVAVGKVNHLKDVKKAMAEIKSSLAYYMQNEESYLLEDAGSRIEAATKSARNMKNLLLAVGIIVFIVGGIGIMNVLFVTVKERTKEIGVLKALGSKSSDILKQFLLESAAIGIFGGTVGVIISMVALYYLSLSGMAILPTISGKIIAFLFAIITSTIFGFYPAYQASQLKPVEALNQE